MTNKSFGAVPTSNPNHAVAQLVIFSSLIHPRRLLII